MLLLRQNYSQDICQKRYAKSFRKYNNQFVKEIEKIEDCQPKAIDAMRLHRYLYL